MRAGIDRNPRPKQISTETFVGPFSVYPVGWVLTDPPEEDAMTQAARITSPSTSEAERARQVEEAVHSVRMEGLDLAPEDSADAAEYVAGRITLDEYGRRTRARYGVPEAAERGSGAPARGAAAAARLVTRGVSRRAQRGR